MRRPGHEHDPGHDQRDADPSQRPDRLASHGVVGDDHRVGERRERVGVGERGPKARAEWTELLQKYRAKYPDLATEIEWAKNRRIPPERYGDREPPIPSLRRWSGSPMPCAICPTKASRNA